MKEKFIELYNKFILPREGAKELLTYIENSDFFSAPASTRYHCAYEGGLVKHCINVYNRLVRLNDEAGMGNYSAQSIAIAGLLHDICKANFYTTEMRNKKNDETGIWEKVPYYTVNDQLPYGHGEKSVYIITGFMRLTRDESMAIRWHMGGFDKTAQGCAHALNEAMKRFPLILLTHTADMYATFFDEAET